jgi:hypothetical protein
MNFDFYSNREDALKVLEFVFCETDLVLFDLYSDYGKKVDRYDSLADAERKLENNPSLPYSHFNVWSPRHGGTPRFERIKLDPNRCEGHTFRYSTLGWGMIQLYFSYPRKNGLSPSHIGHFEERGAYARQDFAPQDDVASWDWIEIRRTSRKLKYHIQKRLAISKVSDKDTRVILPRAFAQFETGLTRLHV